MSSITFAPASFAAPTSVARPLRITRRGRIVLGALIAAPLVAGLVVASVNAPAVAGSESSSATFQTVTVAAGESLWSIAQRVAPSRTPARSSASSSASTASRTRPFFPARRWRSRRSTRTEDFEAPSFGRLLNHRTG
ncbi:hypothetical protein [Naasia aerilata]|uniref:LysM domain-containing protein n=1 Tax=Naasia aerilata TaxID=1162966 RepID=A0ABM8GGT9_9MICO|nr:hypothetical protein [Naasia aerilata]BDZ47574.1 hypothetical protein GCM10025866_34830 [Naasia aerilata]